MCYTLRSATLDPTGWVQKRGWDGTAHASMFKTNCCFILFPCLPRSKNDSLICPEPLSNSYFMLVGKLCVIICPCCSTHTHLPSDILFPFVKYTQLTSLPTECTHAQLPSAAGMVYAQRLGYSASCFVLATPLAIPRLPPPSRQTWNLTLCCPWGWCWPL